MLIYKITNKVNGKMYIGCTTQRLTRRWKQHLNGNNYKKKKFALQHAIEKYGAVNFDIEVIETVDSIEIMYEREIFWVAFYKSNVSGIGYNMTKGGDKLNIMKGKDHPFYGKPNPRWAAIGKARKGTKLTEWHKERLHSSVRGKVRSDEYKLKMSANRKKKWEEGVYDNIGKAISESMKGKVSKKRTLIICLNNNKVYDHYQDAAKKLGLSAGNIPQVVNGKYSHTKGYRFQKVTDEHLIF